MTPPDAPSPTTRTRPITGAVRTNLAELIVPLARAGRDDPAIAALLSITPTQVRGLRTEFSIPAGARHHTAGHHRDETQA